MPGLEAAKAYIALVGAIATALLGIYGPETDVGHWLMVIIAVATAVVTYAVPNRDPRGRHQDESVQPPGERGEVDVLSIIAIVFIVLAILVVLGFIPVR